MSQRVLPCLLAAALLVAGAPSVSRCADGDFYIWSQSYPGILSVNGTTIDDLPGEFEAEDDEVDNAEEGWTALVVDGAAAYSLRANGLVRHDGAKLLQLPYDDDEEDLWVSMAVEDGVVFCLRQDGVVTKNGKTVADYFSEGFVFTELAVRGGVAFSLRSDGAVFRSGQEAPVFRFDGGDGPESDYDDGLAQDSVWIALKFRPDNPFLYALRSDGTIFRGDVGSLGANDAFLPGDRVALLPFDFDDDADDDDDDDDFPFLDDVYVDMEFRSDGTWLVLAGDGRVYGSETDSAVVEDFPGVAIETYDAYADLAVSGTEFWAVRVDGYVYRGSSEIPRITLEGRSYGRIAVSTTLPSVAAADEHPPKCVVYSTKTVIGTPLNVPVMATDVENPSADLVITPTKLPVDTTGSAATWDAAARVLRWDSPQVADIYKFKFTVSDGTLTSEFVFTLEVKKPDTDEKANKEPLLPALTGGKPIAGQPFSFTVVTDDRDGDAVQVTVDPLKYPFDSGATFDPVARRFDWTPRDEDQGERKVKFFLFDGKVQKTLTVTLTVKQSLIF